MKKSILFALLMIAGLFSFAQKNGGDPAAKIQKKVDRMTEQLNLSADQQSQVKELLTAQQQSRKADYKKGSEMTEAEKAAMKAERKAAKAEYDAQLATILTPEQNETYKNLPKEKGKKGMAKSKGKKEYKGKGHKGTAKKSPEEKVQHKVAKLTEELGLSETQQAQMTELMTSRKETSWKGEKAGKEMSADEQEARKAERKAAKEAYKTQFEAILTPEQLATYQKNKAAQKEKKEAKKEAKKEMKKEMKKSRK